MSAAWSVWVSHCPSLADVLPVVRSWKVPWPVGGVCSGVVGFFCLDQDAALASKRRAYLWLGAALTVKDRRETRAANGVRECMIAMVF